MDRPTGKHRRKGHKRGLRRFGLHRGLAYVALALAMPAQAASEIPPPDYKIAFIGDQGGSANAIAVLELIAREGADAAVHSGDFDYDDDPSRWEARIDAILGVDFPYFASVGNHDADAFYGAGGYQEFLQARMNRLGIPWSGDLGVRSSHTCRGIFYVMTAPGIFGAGDGYHDIYIRERLAADDHVWRVSSWHQDMARMQLGGKSDETGWGVYEESRRGGALVATAHEHSYSRSYQMSDVDSQRFDASADPIVLREDDPSTPGDEGTNFLFVSGLGGKSIRGQKIRPTPPWWGGIYTSDQGATYGALFGVFNQGGNPRRAFFYFKDIDGNVIDSFWVHSSLGAVCASGDDDGDSVCNPEDNCRNARNPRQIDSDRDGYGNACDADYDNDGAVGRRDLSFLRQTMGFAGGDPGYRAAADSDADGAIGSADNAFFFRAFGGAPGPSGLGCAGRIPCPAP